VGRNSLNEDGVGGGAVFMFKGNAESADRQTLLPGLTAIILRRRIEAAGSKSAASFCL